MLRSGGQGVCWEVLLGPTPMRREGGRGKGCAVRQSQQRPISWTAPRELGWLSALSCHEPRGIGTLYWTILSWEGGEPWKRGLSLGKATLVKSNSQRGTHWEPLAANICPLRERGLHLGTGDLVVPPEHPLQPSLTGNLPHIPQVTDPIQETWMARSSSECNEHL